MAELLETGPMSGALVRLEPLDRSHVPGLVEAARHGRPTFTHTSVPEGSAAMEEYVAELVRSRSAGDVVPFAQVRPGDGHVVGATRLMTIRRRRHGAPPFAVEIGGTWLTTAAQRTGINREAKLLLLTLAFDGWGVGRVDFVTDARNERSRGALLGIGARLEGVLRSWQPSGKAGEEQQLRDSAMYSVTASEWPTVGARLGGSP